MPIIRNKSISEEIWVDVAKAEAEIGSEQHGYLAFEKWAAESAQLKQQLTPLLAGDSQLEEIKDQLLGLPAIAIEFPSFADGRGYSLATLLRERFGYSGDLIAIGDVLQDQAAMLTRCGFNVLVPREDQPAQAMLKKIGQYAENYQPEGNKPPVWRKRLQG